MNFTTSINQILILFIIIIIGTAAKKAKIITTDIQSSITTILMKIAVPATVIASVNFERSNDVIPNMLQILLITILSYFVIILGCTFFPKSSVFTSLIVFANVGFMGYPVARAFWGETGVFYTAIVNLVFSVLMWTYGIFLFNRNEKLNFKKLLNMGTISTVIALVLFLLQLKLPYTIQTALSMTGNLTTPLSMLLIGSQIGGISIRKLISDKRVYAVCVIKLVLIPAITVLALKAAGTNSTVTSICTIMAAMPSGATNVIFANEFNSDTVFASVGVFMTTLFSILTLPLTVYVLTNFVL